MSHYVRSIHSSLASPSSSSWASSSPYATTSSAAHANSLLGRGYIRYPPGLGHSEWRGPSGSNGPSSTYNNYPRRRTSVSIRSPTSARRPAPPPPPPFRTQPASTSYMKFDPFSDDFSVDLSEPSNLSPAPMRTSTLSPVLYRTPRMSITRPASLPYTIQLEPAPQRASSALDRDARSKLVAGILLNRVHAVGKPMRGRCRMEPKEYVKSRLSSVFSLEA